MASTPPNIDEHKASPNHVAIIMDGNGRWAQARGLPRTAGHKAGAESVRRTIAAAMDIGVPYLTLFGFSSENWKRPKDEVTDLMGLLRFYLRSEIAQLNKEGVRLRVIGERSRFSPDIIKLIEESERLTEGNERLNLTIALSYGGRQDITQAVRAIAEKVRAGLLAPEEITADDIEGALYTAALPEPDLLIRTSGEQRISNFLLWQSAYAEFIFLDVLWPDFSGDDLRRAVDEYRTRDRRFGGAAGKRAV